jgi:pyruvate,water dikinase
MTTHVRFPSPYDIKAPQGAEDWKRLYPYYLVFQDNLKQKEESESTLDGLPDWRIRIKGSPKLLVAFGKCFPS